MIYLNKNNKLRNKTKFKYSKFKYNNYFNYFKIFILDKNSYKKNFIF